MKNKNGGEKWRNRNEKSSKHCHANKYHWESINDLNLFVKIVSSSIKLLIYIILLYVMYKLLIWILIFWGGGKGYL